MGLSYDHIPITFGFLTLPKKKRKRKATKQRKPRSTGAQGGRKK